MRGAVRILVALVCCAIFPTCHDAAFGQTTVKLGVILPKTGPLAILGVEVSRGAQAATAIVNRDGINGAKLEIIEADDGCNPGRAAQLTQELIEREKVNALISSPCANSALAGAAVAGSADILTIALASITPLTKPGQSLLRIVGRDDRLGRIAADYINVNFPRKRVGLATGLPAPLAEALRAELEKRDAKSTRIDAPPGNFAQLSSEIGAVDVGVLPSFFADAIIKAQSARPPIIMPTPVFRDPMAALVKDRGVVVISNPRPDFFEGGIAAMKAAGFEQPESSGYGIYAYAAVELFASLARRTKGDFKGQSLTNAARATATRTVIGALSFDESGDLQNWIFAAYGASSGPDVCRSPQCKDYAQCPRDCPK